MSRLRDKFVQTVLEEENEDASHYKTFRLKRKLQEEFPQLVFHKPRRRYDSEIVFTEDLDQGTVVERALATNNGTEQDSKHKDKTNEANDGGMVQ